MFKLKHLVPALLIITSSIALKAQNNELTLGVRLGHNASLGNFAAISLETDQLINEKFNISGGLQYNTTGRTALEARPAYVHNLDWGILSAEVLLSYTAMHSVNNFAAGAGVGLTGRWVGAKLGYYYRLFGGSGNMIHEPFNIYYELCVKLLAKIADWDLDLIITNNERFELERHFQPSFIAQCSYYPIQRIGVSLGLGCKPAGMFNMSADYYQTSLKLGLCYRW